VTAFGKRQVRVAAKIADLVLAGVVSPNVCPRVD